MMDLGRGEKPTPPPSSSPSEFRVHPPPREFGMQPKHQDKNVKHTESGPRDHAPPSTHCSLSLRYSILVHSPFFGCPPPAPSPTLRSSFVFPPPSLPTAGLLTRFRPLPPPSQSRGVLPPSRPSSSESSGPSIGWKASRPFHLAPAHSRTKDPPRGQKILLADKRSSSRTKDPPRGQQQPPRGKKFPHELPRPP